MLMHKEHLAVAAFRISGNKKASISMVFMKMLIFGKIFSATKVYGEKESSDY